MSYRGLVHVADRYPLLHTPDRWDWAQITMTFSVDSPEDDVITSTHVVGFVGDQVLLCQSDHDDVWFLPGGTREPGESVEASLARELMEEAGGRLVSDFHRLGAHLGVSDADRPYRPHLPHPLKAWLWGWAEVEIVGPPTNPDDGEAISAVRGFPVEEAIARVARDKGWLGELVALAVESRLAS